MRGGHFPFVATRIGEKYGCLYPGYGAPARDHSGESALRSSRGYGGADKIRLRSPGNPKEIDALPEKYDTLLHDLGEPLSLGQRKRIALARTLLKDAYIYIFDEPSAGLDVQNTLRVKRVFETLAKDHIVIIITHDAVLLDECGNKIRIEGAAE